MLIPPLYFFNRNWWSIRISCGILAPKVSVNEVLRSRVEHSMVCYRGQSMSEMALRGGGVRCSTSP